MEGGGQDSHLCTQISRIVISESCALFAPYLRLNSCQYTPRDASGRKREWLKTQPIQGFANLC